MFAIPLQSPEKYRISPMDGRIGGFNFQWAWSSAFVAGRAIATV